MKSRQDICWEIEWCSNCYDDETRNLCYVDIPDHIPDDQILKYIEKSKEKNSE